MGDQFDKAASFGALVRATRACKAGVSHKDAPMEAFVGALGYAAHLQKRVVTGRYHARPGRPVEIYRPKRRTAMAPAYPDRVWQRSMLDSGLYDDLTRGFMPANMACQKGKGVDLAIRTVVAMLDKLRRENPGAEIYGRHLDVHKYFPSTPHEIVKEMQAQRVTEPRFLPYLAEIVDLNPDPRPAEEITADPFGARGTGLGSPINQLNQVALLDDIDHAVAAIVPEYIRYNDDFLLLSADPVRLAQAVSLIDAELSKRGLEMTDKAGLFRTSAGFYFLRKRFIQTSSGKIIIRLHPQALTDERRTLRALARLVREGMRTMHDVQVHYQSWIASASYAGQAPIREMDKFYTVAFRQKPVYKPVRRHLHGNRSYTGGTDPRA